MFYSIKEIYENKLKLDNEEVEVQGWIKSIRRQKTLVFITLFDGSCPEKLQVVIERKSECWDKSLDLNNFSALIVSGKLIFTSERDQPFEVRVEDILSYQKTYSDFPLSKQELSFSYLRGLAHLRAKTGYFFSIFRIRHSLIKSIHDFLDKQNFYNVSPPIITNNDAEGAGEQFFLKQKKKDSSFDSKLALSVSGQLHLEALVQGLGKVYSINPCFRAERSNTPRHLSEFWMLEVELICQKSDILIKLVENLLKYVFSYILTNNKKDLEFLGKELVPRLQDLISQKWPTITYSEAVSLVFDEKKKDNMSLGVEEEKQISNFFKKKPTFVVDFPSKNKPFYVKSKDKKYSISFDLLVSELGEIASGSVREDDVLILEKKTPIKLQWYTDLRKSGYLQTGGFGIGIERLLMFITKCKNIRDSIPFPVVVCEELKY